FLRSDLEVTAPELRERCLADAPAAIPAGGVKKPVMVEDDVASIAGDLESAALPRLEPGEMAREARPRLDSRVRREIAMKEAVAARPHSERPLAFSYFVQVGDDPELVHMPVDVARRADPEDPADVEDGIEPANTRRDGDPPRSQQLLGDGEDRRI